MSHSYVPRQNLAAVGNQLELCFKGERQEHLKRKGSIPGGNHLQATMTNIKYKKKDAMKSNQSEISLILTDFLSHQMSMSFMLFSCFRISFFSQKSCHSYRSLDQHSPSSPCMWSPGLWSVNLWPSSWPALDCTRVTEQLKVNIYKFKVVLTTTKFINLLNHLWHLPVTSLSLRGWI